MEKLFKISLLAFVLSVIVISCSQDSEILPTTENDMLQSRSAKTNYIEMDQMFQHLSQLPNVANMSFMEELSAMNAYAEQTNMSFNMQSAITSYNSAENGATSGFNRGEINILNDIDNILITYGFTPTAKSHLTSLRQDLESGNTRRAVDSALIESIRDLEYLTESPGFASYINAKSSGPSIQQRGFFKCLYYMLQVTYNLYKCAKTVGIGCTKVIYYLDKLWQECPGSNGYVDPCENSNNPCCGITCARGYTCADGDCIPDVNDPGCAVLGCPPGYDCNGYTCIPQ
jgi:hypothetical protein